MHKCVSMLTWVYCMTYCKSVIIVLSGYDTVLIDYNYTNCAAEFNAYLSVVLLHLMLTKFYRLLPHL